MSRIKENIAWHEWRYNWKVSDVKVLNRDHVSWIGKVTKSQEDTPDDVFGVLVESAGTHVLFELDQIPAIKAWCQGMEDHNALEQ